MEDLSLHILDVAENAAAAGASRVWISITEDTSRDRIEIEIRDNGRGMDAETAAKVADPFFTTKTVRRIGLGLPLLKQAAEESAGDFSIRSDLGAGTVVRAGFRRSHIDRKPLGDVAASVVSLVAGNPGIDFVLEYRSDGSEYRFDTAEIRPDLGEVPINAPPVLRLLREEISEGIRTAGSADPVPAEKRRA